MFNMTDKVREKRFRVVCSYTNREWGQISAALNGKKKIINHIISEVKNLEGCPLYVDCSHNQKQVEARQFYPPPETAKIIQELSDRLGIKPSVLVSRLILTPLLQPQP